MRAVVFLTMAANAVGIIIIMVLGERQGWHRLDPAILLFWGLWDSVLALAFGRSSTSTMDGWAVCFPFGSRQRNRNLSDVQSVSGRSLQDRIFGA
jgi:hypothetical protein